MHVRKCSAKKMMRASCGRWLRVRSSQRTTEAQRPVLVWSCCYGRGRWLDVTSTHGTRAARRGPRSDSLWRPPDLCRRGTGDRRHRSRDSRPHAVKHKQSALRNERSDNTLRAGSLTARGCVRTAASVASAECSCCDSPSLPFFRFRRCCFFSPTCHSATVPESTRNQPNCGRTHGKRAALKAYQRSGASGGRP